VKRVEHKPIATQDDDCIGMVKIDPIVRVGNGGKRTLRFGTVRTDDGQAQGGCGR
jgi:hypothetical protein